MMRGEGWRINNENNGGKWKDKRKWLEEKVKYWNENVTKAFDY